MMTSHHPWTHGRGHPSRAASRSGFQNVTSSPAQNDMGDLQGLICAAVQWALQGVTDVSSVDQAGLTAIQPVIQSSQQPSPSALSVVSSPPLVA